MRIAISGSHATGKYTLSQSLAEQLVTYEDVEEPYYLLEAAGHAFSHPPHDDDFVALLEASASLYFRHAAADIVFDRSPADYLAYLAAAFADSIRPEHLAATADALATVDLVVFVPIERPDRVAGADSPKLRRRVDRILREMLIDQAWPFSPRVLEVSGSATERARQVLTALTPT